MDSIAEEVLPDQEYELLVSALNNAEQRSNEAPRFALSCYLNEDHVNANKLVIVLQPRPSFPPENYADISAYSRIGSAGAVSKRTIEDTRLSRALVFYPSRFVLARRIIESQWGILLDFPAQLQALAIKVEDLSLGHSFTHSCVEQTLPSALWTKLFEYQRVGVMRAILQLNGRTLIADEMGLGKTVQALAIAEFYRLRLSSASTKTKTIVLVICPATLRTSWAKAVVNFIPGAYPGIADSPRTLAALLQPRVAKRDLWDGPDMTSHVLVSYDTLCRVDDPNLIACNRHIVIVDECHQLRNISTLRARSALPHIVNARYRILVSGTPALAHPSDIYCILKALLHDTCANNDSGVHVVQNDRSQPAPGSDSEDGFLSLDVFLKRYSANRGGKGSGGGIVRDYELNALLASIMIRRSKEEVRIHLPPKHRCRILFNHSPCRLHGITDAFKKITESDRRDGTHSSTTTMKLYSDCLFAVMYNLTADLKVRCVLFRLAQLVRSLGRRRIIVFAHHVKVLDAVEAFVREQDWGYVRVDSSAACEDISFFQNDDCRNDGKQIRIAILSLTVASVGINLNKADTVLFAELTWTPSVLAQAEDRAHRIGRSGSLHVEYVLIPGSLDDIMISKLQGKSWLTAKITDGGHHRIGHSGTSERGRDVVSACDSEVQISENDVDEFISRYMNKENCSQENSASQQEQFE